MNKLPWFTHDHDAHEDTWIRNLVRKQGHVAGWLWWILLEQIHKHGVGDILKRDINDLSKAAMTSNSVLIRVLTEMATEFQGQTKVRWNLVGTELELEIKKFRERQSNLKSKIISKQSENHSKTTIQRNVNGEGEEQTETAVNGPVDSSPKEQQPLTAALEDSRLLSLHWKIDGEYFMANISSLPVEYCKWALQNLRVLGEEYKKALKLRLKLYKNETIRY